MKKVRVGILGVAEIAERYGIPAFKLLPDVEIVAIASRSLEKAKEAAARHGLEPESYESLIARDDIDVVYCPLPVGLQEEWTLKLAAAGKHVICEKSITYSLESAKRMVDACAEMDVALYENFVPEFHPQHARILALIEEGKIGVPRVWIGAYGYPSLPENDIRYRADLKGGELNYGGCYTAFMARKIMQQEPVAVTCTLSNDGHEVDMYGSALFEFPQGTALMSFGFDHAYQNTYTVWGSKGVIRTHRAFALPPSHAPHVELITNNGKEEQRQDLDIPAANQFALSFDFFCRAVALNDKAQFEDMYDRIIRQAKVLDAMRISAREGKRVEL
ncbi:MAG TPA: Gfo/Idh/MocA family oxidoreductase [Candidatus Paceibacterota bacterium]|nr:Gfo/Idh/MocA family oxidoreductase [Candidatus Paceibacterota bacterium]